MNIPNEKEISAALCQIHYLKGIISGISREVSFIDYTDCTRYCNNLINLFKGMLGEEEEGD